MAMVGALRGCEGAEILPPCSTPTLPLQFRGLQDDTGA